MSGITRRGFIQVLVGVAAFPKLAKGLVPLPKPKDEIIMDIGPMWPAPPNAMMVDIEAHRPLVPGDLVSVGSGGKVVRLHRGNVPFGQVHSTILDLPEGRFWARVRIG